MFGHDPSAFGAKGEMGQEMDGRLFLIDVGMSPATDYSKGALLLIDQAGSEVSATSLEADGTKRELWSGKHAKEVAHHIPAARLGPLLRSEALGHREDTGDDPPRSHDVPAGQRRWKWSPWASAQSPPLPLRHRGLDPFS